ncbi:hypothetical protein ACI2JA_15525 [Alkalihalobacillus sp. NPDC078783]
MTSELAELQEQVRATFTDHYEMKYAEKVQMYVESHIGVYGSITIDKYVEIARKQFERVEQSMLNVAYKWQADMS